MRASELSSLDFDPLILAGWWTGDDVRLIL